MIYQFKVGRSYGVDAQTAGSELERVRRSHGGKLRPDDILDAARPSKSPIHGVFTWDDEKAAHAWRLAEARGFVKAIVVVNDRGVELPAFYNIMVAASGSPNGGESARYYQSAAVIASNPNEYAMALRVMLIELSSAQTGLEKLRSLAPRGQKTKALKAARFLRSASEALR